MNYEIKFDNGFFKSLKEKWLSSLEIYLLLSSVDELIKNKDIFLSKELLVVSQTKNFYYFTESSQVKKFIEKGEKISTFNLRVEGVEKIKCKSVINSKNNLHKRIYTLIPNGKYAFIHCRTIIKTKESSQNDKFSPVIVIKEFSPDYILENDPNGKMLLVIESNLNEKDLLSLIPQISISFGTKLVQCTGIAHNVLSCTIPPQNEQEVIIEIVLSSKNSFDLRKISTYSSNKKPFKYIHNEVKQNIIEDKMNKINYHIFNCSPQELIHSTISLLESVLESIHFYSNEVNFEGLPPIDISYLNHNFNQENLNTALNKILPELKRIDKLYLLNQTDNEGYNILHYISALNFEKSLFLLNTFGISLETKSKDELCAYEICAGKRNFEALSKIIEIIDNEDDKFLFDIDILKSALSISLEKQIFDLNDIKVLDLLIKQIKIKYTVEMTSGKIFDDINNEEEEYEIKKKSVSAIQRTVRRWLKKNQYKRIKKAANTLIVKLRGCTQRKRYLSMKHATILIESKVREWLKKKHSKSVNKE